jgi:hypothetical protein
LSYLNIRDGEETLSGTLEESSVTPSSLVDDSELVLEVEGSRATDSDSEDTVADCLSVS